MQTKNPLTVQIGKLQLSFRQFVLITAIGVVLASMPSVFAQRAQPWPCASVLELLMSRQLLSTLCLGALLLFVCVGLASYKSLAEIRRVERSAALFWGAYAGSSLGPLLQANGFA